MLLAFETWNGSDKHKGASVHINPNAVASVLEVMRPMGMFARSPKVEAAEITLITGDKFTVLDEDGRATKAIYLALREFIVCGSESEAHG